MAKKAVQVTSYGPYFETYTKIDRITGEEWEQEVPAYREVQTQYGIFGVPAGATMTFKIVEDPEKGALITPIYSEKRATMKARTKVKPDAVPATPKPRAEAEPEPTPIPPKLKG
jgi:hypothetical protein